MLYDALKFGCGRKREDSNWIEPVIRTKKGGGTTCVDCDVEKKTKKKKRLVGLKKNQRMLLLFVMNVLCLHQTIYVKRPKT